MTYEKQLRRKIFSQKYPRLLLALRLLLPFHRQIRRVCAKKVFGVPFQRLRGVLPHRGPHRHTAALVDRARELCGPAAP